MIPYGLAFLLAAGLSILAGWHDWPFVLAGHLDGPTSSLRLARLMHGMALGHLTNYAPPAGPDPGALLPWSRLFDALLWALAAPLAVVIGWKQALFAAGVASAPLAMGALGASLAFAARPFAQDRLLFTAAIASCLLPGLTGFAAPGEVDDHIVVVALVACCVGCTMRAWRGATGWSFLAGLSGGFALWLTPAALPFILLVFAALLAGLWQRPIATALVAAAAGLFDVVGFGFAIDPPAGGYATPEIDRISVVYVVLALLLLGAAGLLRRWQTPAMSPPRRRLAGFGLAAGVLMLWLLLFAKIWPGLHGLLPLPPVRGWAASVALCAPALVAAGYMLLRAALSRPFTPGFWLWNYAALCTLLALWLADRFAPVVVYPAAIAAGILPVMLSQLDILRRRQAALRFSVMEK